MTCVKVYYIAYKFGWLIYRNLFNRKEYLAKTIFIISGTEPDCDEDAKFRTITGQCNNLKDGRTLWGSMTISMRRELPSIDDLYQIATYNDLLDSTSDRQGTYPF